LAKGFTRR
jgi:hypothetical protein